MLVKFCAKVNTFAECFNIYISMKKLFIMCIASLLAAACTSNTSNTTGTDKPAGAEFSTPGKILVAVDVQRDFFDSSGALYVSGGEDLPEQIAEIAGSYDAVIFTLDWHPGNHCSFAEQGGIWPAHCVAYTQGAGLPDCFSPILAQGADKVQFFFKGQEQDKEQYGAFEDLGEGCIRHWLENCSGLDICGIAGDYCVKESTANLLKIVPAEKITILTSLVRSIDDGSALAAFIEENGLQQK